MEILSDNLKGKLRSFVNAWLQERLNDEEIWITSSEVVLKRPDETITFDMNELLNFNNPDEKKTLLEKCKEDLNRPGIATIDYPNYQFKRGDKKLKRILKKISKLDFRYGKSTERLETYYYLGEALASRGWIRSDKKMLQDRF